MELNVCASSQWRWTYSFYGKPGGDNGSGVDLDDCKAKFRFAWPRIRARADGAGHRDHDRARSSMRCRAVMSLLAGLGRCRVALPRFTFRNFRSSASKNVCLTRMRAGASRII